MRQWPLTGRARELAAARAALAGPGRGGGVVIVGPAGVGKTRLAHECAALLADRGRPRWCQATAASQSLPLGVFAGVLPADRSDVLRVCADAAAALTTDGAAVLVVDDAHHLDPLSAAVLLHLTTNTAVRLILTLRTGEPVPDAVSALWRDEHLDRVDLGPMTAAETVRLIRAALDGPVDDASAKGLAAMSGGNTLYLREIVRGELRAGRLVRCPAGWRWSGDFTASPALAELIDAATSTASTATRDVLDLLAVAGELDLVTLLRCVPSDAVEAAERSGLIALRPDGPGWRVQAHHPLYAEVRRGRLGPLASRRWRGLVAAALQPADGEHTLQRATLLLDSDHAEGPETYAVAAERAIRLFDYGLGERLAQAAVDAGGGFDAGMLLAFAQGWSNHLEQASATCDRMVRESTTDTELLRATIAAAGHRFFMCAQPDEGIRQLADGQRQIHDPSVAGLLDALGAFFAACDGRPADAVRLARPVLDRPVAPQLEVCALFGLVVGLGFAGRLDEGVGLAERAWTVGSSAFDATHLRLGLVSLQVDALLASGQVAAALRLARRRDSEIAAGLVSSAMVGGFVGVALLGTGDVAGATRRLERCCESVRHDTSGWRYHASSFLARAYALGGRTDRAVRTQDLTERLVHPGHRWFEPERLLTRAWVAAGQGAVSAAVRLCRQTARWSADHGQLVHEVLALQTAARFGDPSGAPRLATLVRRVDGPRAPAALAHARGLAAADPDALRTAAEAYLELGDRLSAADAYAQAAVLLTSGDRVGDRADAARRAASLQQECAASTPALRLALHPLPLTSREREVATLAAHGLSNRSIATLLQLSVRTVEGHLYWSYGRLGVDSRAGLEPLLAATGAGWGVG